MARINLPRQFVVRVYWLARQAERSVDAALFAPWSELVAYYTDERAAKVRDILGDLQSLLQRKGMVPPPVEREEFLQSVRAPGAIRHLSGPYLARWKTLWTFSDIELGFVAATFESFLNLLHGSLGPSKEMIISMRMDFRASQYLIECRCDGMPELARATHIEHFNQPRHITPVKLSDLVSGPLDKMDTDSSRSMVVPREQHR